MVILYSTRTGWIITYWVQNNGSWKAAPINKMICKDMTILLKTVNIHYNGVAGRMVSVDCTFYFPSKSLFQTLGHRQRPPHCSFCVGGTISQVYSLLCHHHWRGSQKGKFFSYVLIHGLGVQLPNPENHHTSLLPGACRPHFQVRALWNQAAWHTEHWNNILQMISLEMKHLLVCV